MSEREVTEAEVLGRDSEPGHGSELALPDQAMPEQLLVVPLRERPFFPSQPAPVVLDHAHGRAPRHRTEIPWPAGGTVEWLRDLRDQWPSVLPGLDLDAVAPFPWDRDPEHPVAHMVAWVNAELMKNVAEIGQLRLLRAARGG